MNCSNVQCSGTALSIYYLFSNCFAGERNQNVPLNSSIGRIGQINHESGAFVVEN